MLYRYDNTQREHKFFVLKTESDYHIINPNGCIFYYQLPLNILKQTAKLVQYQNYNIAIHILLRIKFIKNDIYFHNALSAYKGET